MRYLQVGEAVKHAVKKLVRHLHEKWSFPLHAASIHDVIALTPLLHELLYQLRRVLQIAVKQHTGILARYFHAAPECSLRAKIAGVGYTDHPAVVARQAADHFLAVIGAAIVDKDN